MTGPGIIITLRTAAGLSRLMRGSVERGALGELAGQMSRRDGLIAEAAASLAALEGGGDFPAGDREELAGMLRELESENMLLIEVLEERQRQIVRCIAEAEGHRRLSAYAR